MSDQVYDVLKDLVVPGLSGIGSILVGIGAVSVALRVRDDEQKRATEAARERYRDQLFQVIEPGVSALLAHRAELMKTHRLLTSTEGILRSEVISRLWMIQSATNAEDAKLVDANRDAFQDALDTGRADVTIFVVGQMALMLPSLLHETRDIDNLVKQTNGFVASGVARTTSASPPATGTPPTP